MRILLVTWYFPPTNEVAALRTGATARYLTERGHQVHVLTAKRNEPDISLQVPLPEDHIVRTRWLDIDRLKIMPTSAPRAQLTQAKQTLSQKARRAHFARLRAFASDTYLNLVHIPDRQNGWLPFAISAGREIVRDQNIELIYASGPSFTSFLAAKSLSKRFGLPWVAEYRDGWSGDFYRPRAKWRQAVDRHLESLTTGSAAGIIAVSEPWADYYRKRFGKPTVAIYNGFDVETVTTMDRRTSAGTPISIRYLGQLYGAFRDPSPLYRAIELSKLKPSDIQIEYFGPSEKEIRPLAEKFGVSACVQVKSRVSYSESLRIQRESDVLLLLQAPDDPRNVPAKVFEYLASGRPILGLGLDNGVPATLIRERGAGFYDRNPVAIAQQLIRWVEQKRATGVIDDVPASARSGLSRSEQFATLEHFLEDLCPQKLRRV